MPIVVNRARMTTSSTGTGTITLVAAVAGLATFAEAGVSDGDEVPYVIEEGNDFEIGIGTYTASGTALSRDTVRLSKIGGSAGTSKMNLGGNAEVFISPLAEELVGYENATALSGDVVGTSDTQTLSNKTLEGGTVSGTDGLDFNSGSDQDIDLISVIVTNSPVLSWDEAESSFKINSGLRISGGASRVLKFDDGTMANGYILKANVSDTLDFGFLFEDLSGNDLLKIDSSGDVTVSGALSKGSGSFRIDHPLKPDTHWLYHSFVEAPTADNIYRGRVRLADGQASVNIDEASNISEGTFAAVNGNVQVWVQNETGWEPVRGRVSGNILTIECKDPASADTVSWLVIGERQDQHMLDTQWTDEFGRVRVERLKTKEELEKEIYAIYQREIRGSGAHHGVGAD